MSIESFPTEAVIRLCDSSQQENDIHDPPHTHPSKGEQLGYTEAGVAETKPVDSKESKEHRKENNGRKVVAIIPAGENIIMMTTPSFCTTWR